MTLATKTIPARAGLFESYRPLPGVPDELVDANGDMRPAWSSLITHLSAMTPDQIETAFALGHQYLANSGVFFRRYGDRSASNRDWPLSPIPVILPETEWRDIEAGLIQRAELLELVAADIYGPNRLVAEGHLPGKLVATNPEWLRPMVGIRPKGGHFLHFMAFEIGRGPDGRWWVLLDRTDAPSGAGFALENRVATSRIFPELHRNANVHRLAGFFREFRSALGQLRSDGSSAASILTPGPMSDTYDEHAYIARYLGLPLLEGEDMLVENGQLRVRTIDGLVPVDVLWRRMDSAWADPLELREDSQLGTPGLLSAIRQGSVTMVNALGVGILEMQALPAFLPTISQVLTGRPLAMPGVATWWCGQSGELDYVRANADRMMIGRAIDTRLPFESEGSHAIGGTMRGGTDEGLDDWLAGNAEDLVAKELVTLSTTPVHQDGKLVPRPMSLRVYLARTENGWQAMPGGFARVGASTDTLAVSMRNGGAAADVWIASDSPVEPVTLLARSDQPFVRAGASPLPSQAADNLFWVGRYVERTEGLLRLVRAYNVRLEEAASETLLGAIQDLLEDYGVDATEPFPAGVLSTLSSAVYSASQIRDRFNVDGWAALMDMEKSMSRISRTTIAGSDAASVMTVMLRKIAGFSGLIHENMYRTSGWQFLTLGRSLERAGNMADLLSSVTHPKAPDGGLELAIEVGDSIIVHRQRYAISTSRESVIDLMALDATNPRSIMFHLKVAVDRIRDLSRTHSDSRTGKVLRKATALLDEVASHTVESLDSAALSATRRDIDDLSVALNAAFIH